MCSNLLLGVECYQLPQLIHFAVFPFFSGQQKSGKGKRSHVETVKESSWVDRVQLGRPPFEAGQENLRMALPVGYSVFRG